MEKKLQGIVSSLLRCGGTSQADTRRELCDLWEGVPMFSEQSPHRLQHIWKQTACYIKNTSLLCF